MHVNRREHLQAYVLASAANTLLSLGQFFAVSSALGIRISQQLTVAGLLSYDGSRASLWVNLVQTGLIFQGAVALLVIVVLGVAVSRARWKWIYALTMLVISSYVGYVLGMKFLDTLEWLELDLAYGLPGSDVYANMITFGLAATSCYFLMIMVLNKSYGKLVLERTG